VVGAVPALAAVAAWWASRRGRAGLAAGIVAVAAVGFVGALAAGGAPVLDAHKAPRALVAATGAGRTDVDVRVGCFAYYQPSLVFYCRREVHRLTTEQAALDFLKKPLPVYLFLPEAVWQQLQPHVTVPCRLLARHPDLYRRLDVVVVTNQPADGDGVD
jgi:hypothetical protein